MLPIKQYTPSASSDCQLNFPKRHVLADSGIDYVVQRAIVVTRFAVLDFHRALSGARPAIGRGGQCIANPHVACAPIERGHADVVGCQTCTLTIVLDQRFSNECGTAVRRSQLRYCRNTRADWIGNLWNCKVTNMTFLGP
jgi:hypothetical protein